MPTYTGISSEAFRHPLDRQAEQALRSVPGFDIIAGKFVEFVSERPNFIYQLGNSIQVGPRQYGSIYGLFRECVRTLDIYPEPTLFISQTPLANAFALGQERPFIVLNSGLLDLLTEAELRAVVAHELGHLKCGHTTLTQMAIWALQAINLIGNATFGISRLVSTGLILAFYEWSRKAELSADRAALLVMDDLNPVMHCMMKLAGGSVQHVNESSLEEFIRQSDNYQELDQDGLNQVYKFLLYNNVAQGVFLSHPFPVERLRYIREWATSEEYRQIRQGNYQRASAEGAVNVSSETPTNNEVEALRRQLEELQREIDRIRSQSKDS
ncbi:M48 family metallopeptidase [Microcoleus sp. FACHB-831]|jgi:Zn-dependent protease with chaperone function|uniref:M48 family metallopeptidase n=1 Tax=Microcoleus sp. FACHB-831 TaxID=2692827 RepID=UPI001687F9E6|nr:M48 family metallopeptidase [Microcoleus sp. FACHB-831]MBD1922902.1 M48 family metallopeptidase [Microcoleus sp. FACHB-831]